MLRGDGSALDEAAQALANGDRQALAAWNIQLQRFFEAVLAQALAAGLVDPPSTHPFWGPLTTEQRRLTLDGLATLGYRFDGIGGWRDGHVPTRRDLSLALGSAGVDPVRIRTWPTPMETERLLALASIAGAEFLEHEAPSLSRHQIELILKPYGARLKVLVDEWERVRAALVEEEATGPPV